MGRARRRWDALRELEAQDGRKARAVEMHFFGGLTHEEIAGLLEVSVSTVQGDLRLAKAWLAARLEDASRNDAAAPREKGGPG